MIETTAKLATGQRVLIVGQSGMVGAKSSSDDRSPIAAPK
jgi:hypothetical protein